MFGWADSLKEAEFVIVLHCYFHQKVQAYYVLPTWNDQDITVALIAIREMFGVVDTGSVPSPS